MVHISYCNCERRMLISYYYVRRYAYAVLAYASTWSLHWVDVMKRKQHIGGTYSLYVMCAFLGRRKVLVSGYNLDAQGSGTYKASKDQITKDFLHSTNRKITGVLNA